MISKMKVVNLLVGALFSAGSLTACGGSNDMNTTPVAYQDAMLLAQQNQNQCCCCCEEDGTTNSDSTTTDTPKTPTKTDSGTKTEDKGTTTTPTTPKTEDKAETPKDTTPTTTASKGRQALDKVMNFISSASSFESEVEKYEKSISDASKSTQQTLKFYARKPGQVKIEVLSHSKPSNAGAKMSYVVGTGKATVRPGGALSFIVKEFDQTDSNITSPNEYSPESCDYFSMTKRLSQADYKADITGKTTIAGKEVYLIKLVKQTGKNELDPRITHEIIGFDAKTFEPKLWEAYAGEKDAYMRMNIKSFKKVDSLADSIFKV